MSSAKHIHTPVDDGLVVRVSEKVKPGQVWLHPNDAAGRERVVLADPPPPTPARRARMSDDEAREHHRAMVAETLEKRRRCPHRFGEAKVCPDCGEERPR